MQTRILATSAESTDQQLLLRLGSLFLFCSGVLLKGVAPSCHQVAVPLLRPKEPRVFLSLASSRGRSISLRSRATKSCAPRGPTRWRTFEDVASVWTCAPPPPRGATPPDRFLSREPCPWSARTVAPARVHRGGRVLGRQLYVRKPLAYQAWALRLFMLVWPNHLAHRSRSG